MDDFGCVLFHGFGGRPFEMQFLAENLRSQGYAVVVPTLAGHDGDRSAFDRSRFSDWLGSAREAYHALKQTCRQVAVAGFSMGGTLALTLAEELDVAAVVCISSPIFLCRLYPYWAPDWRMFFSGPVSRVCPLLPTSMPAAESRRIAPWEGYEGLHHLRPLHSLRMGALQTGRNLARITAPLLAVHGDTDRAVHPDNAWTIARGVSSTIREVHLLSVRERITSGHLLVTHEETKALVGTLVSGFLEKVRKS